MIPGITAGYPRSPEPAGGFILTSEWFPGAVGENCGFDERWPPPVGSLNPPFSSVVPGAPPISGANGELINLFCERVGTNQWYLYFEVRGIYSVPPFAEMILDGVSLPASQFGVFVFEGGTTSFDRGTYFPTNVMAPGVHTLQFV